MQDQIQSAAKTYFRTRDPKHFTSLYELLRPIIYNVSRKVLRDHDDAEENTAGVLYKLSSNENYHFDPEKPFVNYAITVTHNSAKTLFNKNKNKKVIPVSHQNIGNMGEWSNEDYLNAQMLAYQGEEAMTTMEDDQSSLRQHEIVQKLNVAMDAINEFPSEQRLIIIDALISEMDYKDIQEKYGFKSVGAIKTRVFRARTKIKNRVAGHDLFRDDYVNDSKKSYYPNGKIRFKYNIINEQLNGEFKEYYPTGELKASGTYLDGKRKGDYVEHYPCGTIKKHGVYVDGKKEGIWKLYGTDQKIMEKVDYFEGQAGYYELYEDGNIQTGIYGDEEDTPIRKKDHVSDNLRVTHFPNGRVKTQIGIFGEELHGPFKRYRDCGSIMVTGEHEDGLRQGVYTEYYHNGNIRKQGTYENGNKVGIWRHFNQEGQLTCKSLYEENEMVSRQEGASPFKFDRASSTKELVTTNR